MPAVIDSHHHVWVVGAHDFAWPPPDLAAIHRDFGPADLVAAAAGVDLVGTVLVQSQPSLADTLWLLDVAGAHPLVKAVVGWVDFDSPDAIATIDRLTAHPKFRGLRPMLQILPDDDWVSRADLDPVFDHIVSRGLTLDALVFPRHLPALEARLRRHPDLRVVIDHGAKPDIAGDGFADWAPAIARIAGFGQVCCKLSGLPAEMGAGQGMAALVPYVRHLVACFGAQRLMWGSDWPVVNLNADYRLWLDSALSMTGLHGADLDRLCTGTAMQFYSIEWE